MPCAMAVAGKEHGIIEMAAKVQDQEIVEFCISPLSFGA